MAKNPLYDDEKGFSSRDFSSVFDNASEAESEFDCMFCADEDDRLMDKVMGFKEDATSLPDDDELHQNETEGKGIKTGSFAGAVKDLRDEVEGDPSSNKPTADSAQDTGDGVIEDDIDDALDIACPKFGIADSDSKNKIDPEHIDDASEKTANKVDKFEEAYTSLLEDLGISDDNQTEDLEDDNDDTGLPGDTGLDGDVGLDEEFEELPSELPGGNESHPNIGADIENECDLISGVKEGDDDISDDDDDDDDDFDDDDDDKEGGDDDDDMDELDDISGDSFDEGCGSKKSVKETDEKVSDDDEGDPGDTEVDESAFDAVGGYFHENDKAVEDDGNIIDAVDKGRGEENSVAYLDPDSDEDLIDMVLGEDE